MREITEEEPGYQIQENNLKQKVEIIKQKNVLKILQDNLFHKVYFSSNYSKPLYKHNKIKQFLNSSNISFFTIYT